MHVSFTAGNQHVWAFVGVHAHTVYVRVDIVTPEPSRLSIQQNAASVRDTQAEPSEMSFDASVANTAASAS